jgi:hypothetical protein
MEVCACLEAMARDTFSRHGWSHNLRVGDIPNGYTSDVVLNQQARVAHGGGMADCLLGSPVARKPMADTGRRSLWRIRRQAHGGLPCSTRIGLSLGLHIVSAPVPS